MEILSLPNASYKFLGGGQPQQMHYIRFWVGDGHSPAQPSQAYPQNLK